MPLCINSEQGETSMKQATKPQSARALVLASLLGSAALLPATSFASGYAVVTDSADSLYKGTLRHALEVKKASKIYISKHVGDIEIYDTLTYSKRRPLSIYGSGQTIKANDDFTLLALTEGASLNASHLSFQGPGGFDVNNRADGDGISGKGIFIDVRDDQKGTVYMNLKYVQVSDVANHGIHISDCTLADECGSGSGGGGDGSNASVHVNFYGVTVDNAGNGKFDADGLRVDERGKGSIFFQSYKSLFTNVGADGVELDEGDNGGVFSYNKKDVYDRNGNYCDPDEFIGGGDDLEFSVMGNIEDDDDALIAAKDTYLMDTATADRPNNDVSCFEVDDAEFNEDSGMTEIVLAIDLDDGIDLDEAGNGSIDMTMIESTISNNLDEGVDLDEEGKGRMEFKFIRSTAIGNNDDGVKLSEEDEGGVIVKVVDSKATQNDKGFVFEEANKGSIWFDISKTDAVDNGGDGFEIVEEDGNGSVEGSVVSTTSTGNDGRGFDLLEEDNGSLFVKFYDTTASGNEDEGIRATQEGNGTGVIKLINSDIDDTDLDGVVEE